MKANHYKKAISVRQPWAWAIIHGGKDVENRTWEANYRDQFLIHARKTFDWNGYLWIMERERYLSLANKLPQPDEFFKGGFIGAVNIIVCAGNHSSKWFSGPFGFVLECPIIFDPPVSYSGQLKIFDVPRVMIKKGLLRTLQEDSSESYLTNKL